jgi:hypothetical protein
LLVELESTLNNNPRLETVVGFLFQPRRQPQHREQNEQDSDKIEHTQKTYW